MGYRFVKKNLIVSSRILASNNSLIGVAFIISINVFDNLSLDLNLLPIICTSYSVTNFYQFCCKFITVHNYFMYAIEYLSLFVQPSPACVFVCMWENCFQINWKMKISFDSLTVIWFKISLIKINYTTSYISGWYR